MIHNFIIPKDPSVRKSSCLYLLARCVATLSSLQDVSDTIRTSLIHEILLKPRRAISTLRAEPVGGECRAKGKHNLKGEKRRISRIRFQVDR